MRAIIARHTSQIPHNSEPDVSRGTVRHRSCPRGAAVPAAVRGVAKMRSALHNAVRARRRPHRINRRRVPVPQRIEPILTPLPGVAHHVMQSIGVRRERGNRCRTHEPIFAEVRLRENSLPDIAHVPSIRCEVVTPRVGFLFEPPASRELPLGFGGQPVPRPFAVSGCIGPRDMHNRVIQPGSDRTLAALGTIPPCPFHTDPPRSLRRSTPPVPLRRQAVKYSKRQTNPLNYFQIRDPAHLAGVSWATSASLRRFIPGNTSAR